MSEQIATMTRDEIHITYQTFDNLYNKDKGSCYEGRITEFNKEISQPQ